MKVLLRSMMVVCLVLGVVVMGSTVPPLPTAFRVSMYEKLVTDVGVSPAPQTFNWTIDYAIDYSLLSARIAHSAGQYDEICSSIPGHEHTQEPCVEYITPEWRYVHLPGPNICCKCCPSPGFCGVVKPTWATNGVFVGTSDIPTSGPESNKTQVCNEYQIQGTYVNHWYITADSADSDTAVPCRFWESKPGKVPLKQITYDLDTWTPGPVPKSTFDLPDVPGGCDTRCPGICSKT